MTDDQIPAFVETLRDDAERSANRRILATAIKLNDAADLIERLFAERNALLSACEDAEHDIRQRARPDADWLEKARAAIASAKGQ